MLFGRDGTCQRLTSILTSAAGGAGAAVALVGSAGIGKTALLDFVAQQARDLRVIRVQGFPGEAGIPYAGLSQILTPLMDDIGTLSAPQAEAVLAALALGPSMGGGAFPVYLGVLNLLAAAAARQPQVVLVDDGHLLDAASIEALGFVVRRLMHDSVLFVLAFRPDPGLPQPPAGVEKLEIEGLDADAATALLAEQGHELGANTAGWLVRMTGGNPLALRDLPTFASPSDLADYAVQSLPAPIGPVLEHAYGRATTALSTDARQATLIVAVLDDAEPRVVERALAFAGLDIDALVPGEDIGLLEVTPVGVRMRHPLMRSAIMQLVPPSQRRAARRAAADGLLASTRPRHRERRVWHLAEASVGVDEDTALLLEEMARAAVVQAGYASACLTFQRAAELSAAGPGRVRRLLAGADAAFAAGLTARCQQLLARAIDEAGDAPQSGDAIEHLHARVETWSHDPKGAARLMQLQAQRIAHLDPVLSIKLSVDAAAAAALSGQMRLASEIAELVASIVSAGGPEAQPIGDLLVGSVQAMRGDGNKARPLLDRCRAALEQAKPSAELLQPLIYLATSYHFIDAFTEALSLFRRSIDLARSWGALGQLPFALAHLASTHYRTGAWDSAYVDATEALTLAEESGRAADRPIAAVMRGMIDAARGNEAARDDAQLAIREGDALGAQFIVAQGYSVLGLLELSAGRPSAAIGPLQECAVLATDLELFELGYLQWAAELVEALARTGRAEEAVPTLRIMERATHQETIAVDRALLARCRGIIANDDSWERHFNAALTLHREMASRPFELARTALCFGERLRRQRRRRDARTQFTVAWETFYELGADPWAQRAAQELAATGISVPMGPITHRSDLLTPQELQVATAVSTGATNREVADALFLSLKTVEFHLSAVYRRLGVRSRTDLASIITGRAETARP